MSYISQNVQDYQNRFKNVRDYILYSLGWPVIRVELHESHLTIAIIDAVTRYYDRAAMDYGVRNVTPNNNIIDIPVDIKPTMIQDVIWPMEIIDTFSRGMFVAGTEDVMGKYVVPQQSWNSVLDNFDMAGYYMFLQKLEDFKKIVGIDRHWERINNQIQLYPGSASFPVVGLIYKMNNTDEQLETEVWIKEWALAKAKHILGTIRSKMSGFQTAGGNISADGEALKSEAQASMEKLTEELNQLQRPLPIMQF